jgi:hypothetical protein
MRSLARRPSQIDLEMKGIFKGDTSQDLEVQKSLISAQLQSALGGRRASNVELVQRGIIEDTLATAFRLICTKDEMLGFEALWGMKEMQELAEEAAVTEAGLRDQFTAADSDDDHFLNFSQFLELVQNLRVREGAKVAEGNKAVACSEQAGAAKQQRRMSLGSTLAHKLARR